MDIEGPRHAQRDLFENNPSTPELTRSELEGDYVSLFGSFPDTKLSDEQLRAAVEFPEQEIARIKQENENPSFDNLSSEFQRLTGYTAGAYGFISPSSHNELERIVTELRSLTREERKQRLIGLAIQQRQQDDTGGEWWQRD
jgi:hypothetical protein